MKSTLLILLFAVPADAMEHDWRYHARRLTGFSETTQRDSLRQLRATKDLETKLPEALKGRDRFLALDVISTLSLTPLLPTLFGFTRSDESGAVALAINALLTPETRTGIIGHYSHLLSQMTIEPLSVPTAMAILDVLGRLKHDLPEEMLESLMDSPAPMIRSAAVYYARMLQRETPGEEYRAVFERGLQDPTVYIRTQTQSVVGRALPPAKTETWWEKFQAYFATKTPARPAVLDSLPPQEFLPAPPKKSLHKFSLKAKDKILCEKTYNHFFKNPSLDLRIVFGYKDARPARFVGDRYEAAWFASYLTAPCPDKWHACGFKRDQGDPGLFRKLVTGPDGRPRDVRITLAFSSASADDDQNRKDSFQKWISDRAETAFLEGVGKADAVFYNGHSRDGGGPDFAPPRLTADHHVEYDWYAREKPGMGVFLKKLSKSNLPLLGFFSCASTGHFLNEINESNKKVATITSPKLIYYSDAMKNMLNALSALLGRECEADFNLAIRAKAEVGDSHLIGFFKR